MSLLVFAQKMIARHHRRRFAHQMSRLRRAYANSAMSIETMLHEPDFAEIRESIRNAGTASLTHFGNGYAFQGGYHLQQNPDEFASLILFLRARGPFANYLEIGSASGGACLMLYQNVNLGRVISLDDGRHPDAHLQDRHFAQIAPCERFVGDSHGPEAREFLERTVHEWLDLAFIDGDHSYTGVLQDIDLVMPFCRRGSFMLFHDTVACDGVARAWQEIVAGRRVIPRAEFIGAEKPLGIAVGEVR